MGRTRNNFDNRDISIFPTKEALPLAKQFGVGVAQVGVSLYVSDGKSWTSSALDASVIILGSDHPNIQHYGEHNNGLSRMYADLNIPHYIAFNTDYAGIPGAVNQMTWDQVGELIANNGTEIVSHGSRHPNNWDELSTGIQLKYNGTGSAATVTISGTFPAITISATVTGDAASDFSFALDNAAYDTVGELLTAINAVNGGNKWAASKPLDLPDNIPSNKLLTIASVDAKTALKRFSCGGGITVQYTGTTYQSAHLTISTSAFTLYANGVQVYAIALSGRTLQTLVNDINAISGFVAKVCNDNGGNGTTDDNYTSGAESASNLIPVPVVDCMARKAILTAGIPHWQMVDLSLQASKDFLINNGIDVKDFAQSGGNFHEHITYGHGQFGVYRGNPDQNPVIAPYAMPFQSVDNFVLQHATLSQTRAQMEAAVNALADCPGFLSCWLMHNVAADGSSGYSLNYAGYAPDTSESDWYYILKLVRQKMDAGNLRAVRLHDANKLQYPKTKSLVFNPRFINSGEVLSGLASDGSRLPGWLLTSVTAISTLTVEAQKLKCVSTGNAVAARQTIYLEPGETYEIGVLAEIDSYTSGSGVNIQLAKLFGAFPGLKDGATLINSDYITKTDHIKLRFTVPGNVIQKPQVISLAGPFNLSTNNAIKLNIFALGAIDNLNVAAGAGNPAAVTATEAAAAINAAIKASATYAALGEYHNLAKAVNGKLVLENPVINSSASSAAINIAAATTASATATIFGNANCNAYSIPNQQASAIEYAFSLILISNMVGTVRFSAPYCEKVRYF